MGGKREYVIKIADLYEEMLTEALPLGMHTPCLTRRGTQPAHLFFTSSPPLGCLGTEETMLSLVWYNRCGPGFLFP